MGEHVYRAVVLAADKDGALHELASTEVRFVVKAHAAPLNVWDVPSAIEAGGRFKFMVGVRCSAGCCLAGHELGVFDGQGYQIGAAKLGSEVWPETDALYVAEVEGEAPVATGAYQWEVRTSEWDCELPHEAARGDGVPSDRRSSRLRSHGRGLRPGEASSDQGRARGHASVSGDDRRERSCKGQRDQGPLRHLVSASKYVPIRTTAEVTADMITRAELEVESSLGAAGRGSSDNKVEWEGEVDEIR